MEISELYTHITECRLCGSDNLVSVLDLTDQPLANALRHVSDQPLQDVPLHLVFCDSCKTGQLNVTVDPEVLFSDYVWVTGTSKTACDYSEEFARNVIEKSGIERPLVVEVASNDGTFLKKFQERGCVVLGVDPAQNIAEKAEKLGVPTVVEFFNTDVALEVAKDHGAADIVIARNVIPHVKEIHSIIGGMKALVSDQGIAVIEFHHARSIVDELHYDSIYHEHLFYFSASSIVKLCASHGLHAFDVFHSPISGGSLVLFFKTHVVEPTSTLHDLLMDEENIGLNTLSAWLEFGEASTKHADSLRTVVGEYTQKEKIVAYGASARSSTLMNFVGLSSDKIDFVIDKNPLKHGLLTPGTDIPIISYDEGISLVGDRAILLLAWNFEDEIVRDLRNDGFRGDIILPLPGDVRIL